MSFTFWFFRNLVLELLPMKIISSKVIFSQVCSGLVLDLQRISHHCDLFVWSLKCIIHCRQVSSVFKFALVWCSPPSKTIVTLWYVCLLSRKWTQIVEKWSTAIVFHFLGCPMCRVISHLQQFWICDLPLWQGSEMYVYHVCALKFAADNQTIFYDTRSRSRRPCAMMATSSASLHFVHSLDSNSPLLSSVLSISGIATCKAKLEMKTDWQFQSPRYMQWCDKLLGLILERLRITVQSCGSPSFSPT